MCVCDVYVRVCVYVRDDVCESTGGVCHGTQFQKTTFRTQLLPSLLLKLGLLLSLLWDILEAA